MKLRPLVRIVPALALVVCASAADAQQPDTIIPPSLTNASEVTRALDDAYPHALQARGIGGLARLRLFITAEGVSDTMRLAGSTGLASLDHAARMAAAKAEFSAATLHDRPIAGWVDLNVQFEGREDGVGDPVMIPLSRRDEMMPGFQSFYPADLREARVGASVGLSLTVDRAGTVIEHRIVDPSCFATANESAAALLLALAFDPIEDGPIMRRSFASVTFSADSVRLLLFGDTTRRDTTAAAHGDGDARRGEARPPRLRNRPGVQRALISNYPVPLRDKGIGGTTTVYLRVEENGRVTYRIVAASSGRCQLDAAALRVAEVMRFDPALEDGEPVTVWVELPIVFSAR